MKQSNNAKAASRHQKIKSSQGYPIGKPPYGYMRDPENPKRWVVDEDAAEIVRRIYKMRLEGNSIESIAVALRRDKVDMPSVYAVKKGYSCPNNRLDRAEYWWRANMVDLILKNQSYYGDVINFKTFSKSYKETVQKVEIHFNFIGEVNLPDVEQRRRLIKSFGKEKREQIA